MSEMSSLKGGFALRVVSDKVVVSHQLSVFSRIPSVICGGSGGGIDIGNGSFC
jgi:hypothetical protein